MSKLSLDRDKVEQSRKIAEQIASPILHQVERHTTVSIERSVLRLLGVEGPADEKFAGDDAQGRYPLVNMLEEKIGMERLTKGAGYWLGLAACHHPKLNATQLARKIVSEEIDLEQLKEVSPEVIDKACQKMMEKQIGRLRSVRELRQERLGFRDSKVPLKYVIVATGNIQEDIRQAQAAAEMGADIIAVIRSTAQSLLDYVPEGETTEGFGGTYATQANFRVMRQALDETEKKLRKRIGLTNYSSGLCMPEIAVLGALEGVDYLLNDAMYGILFRDINMKRNFIDQNFSRRICALSGITIQTGEDNYLTTADSYKYWHQVLASHMINLVFAKAAGLAESHISFGHAFEMDPEVEDSMLYEWAQAQLVREVFPRSPIKFMPPTKHKSGDVFFSYLYDGMFNLAGVMTGQSIQLLGMHTEAIHNPFIQDRYLSLKSANYIFNAARSAFEEISFQSHGKIARRARQVTDDSLKLLKKIMFRGLFRAIEEGAFANVRRSQEEGKGLAGVIYKARDYYTPLQQYLALKPSRSEDEYPVRTRPLSKRREPHETTADQDEPKGRTSRTSSRQRPKSNGNKTNSNPRRDLPKRDVESSESMSAEPVKSSMTSIEALAESFRAERKMLLAEDVAVESVDEKETPIFEVQEKEPVLGSVLLPPPEPPVVEKISAPAPRKTPEKVKVAEPIVLEEKIEEPESAALVSPEKPEAAPKTVKSSDESANSKPRPKPLPRRPLKIAEKKAKEEKDQMAEDKLVKEVAGFESIEEVAKPEGLSEKGDE